MDFSEYQERTGDTNVYGDAIRKYLEPVSHVLEEVYFGRADELSDEEINDALGTLDFIEKLMNISYALLGYAGEVGEICNGFKKVLRGDRPLYKYTDSAHPELGDSLYYFARTAHELGLNANWIAQDNIEKLADRKERGVLKGDGDGR